MSFREDKNLKLHRVEYIYFEDRTINWVWIESMDDMDYLTNDDDVEELTWRLASEDEIEVYDEAFADGHGIAIAESRMERSNEVYFEINNMNDEGTLVSRKIFTCGVCEKTSLDFDSRAAKTGEFYITKDIESVLWHVCIECAYDCRHDWSHFSAAVCDCGSLHSYCDTCSEPLGCELEQEANADSPYKRKKK